MPTRIALALAAAIALLALPAAAPAKGIASLAVCGAGACHAVDARAVRALEGDVAVRRPARAESWYLLRARARISNGDVAEVWTAEWLPRAGVLRTTGAGADWIAAPPRLRVGLERAARGLRARRASTLSPLGPPEAGARVVEVFSPADDARDGAGGAAGTIAAVLAAAVAVAAAAVALAVRRRAERRTAALHPSPR
jgi:hypothetical protein